MKSLRDFSSGMLGRFKGYDDKSMAIVRILCDAGADENLTPGLTVPKRKEGCSCGKCIEGWLSPRTRYRSVLDLAELKVPLCC